MYALAIIRSAFMGYQNVSWYSTLAM